MDFLNSQLINFNSRNTTIFDSQGVVFWIKSRPI